MMTKGMTVKMLAAVLEAPGHPRRRERLKLGRRRSLVVCLSWSPSWRCSSSRRTDSVESSSNRILRVTGYCKAKVQNRREAYQDAVKFGVDCGLLGSKCQVRATCSGLLLTDYDPDFSSSSLTRMSRTASQWCASTGERRIKLALY